MLNHCSTRFIKAAMHRQKVADEAGVSRQPSLSSLPFMDAQIVKDQVDASHGGWNLPTELVEEGDEFFLAFASCGSSVDEPFASLKGGKQVESSCTPVLVFQAKWRAWSRR